MNSNDSLGIAKAILDIANKKNINANYTDEEKSSLIGHFKKDDLNQFYQKIVSKVVSSKTFTVPNDKLIPYLISTLADIPNQSTALSIVDDESIIEVANSLYRLLSVLDVDRLYNNEF
jgi:hypothetical protein